MGRLAPTYPVLASRTRGFLVFAALVSSGTSYAQAVRPDPRTANPGASFVRGSVRNSSAGSPARTSEEIYKAYCLKCHDADGTGEAVRDVMKKIPDFTDATWHRSLSDQRLSRSIQEGKGNSMPRMSGKLNPNETRQLVAFVRGFRSGRQVVDEEVEETSRGSTSATNTPVPAVAPAQEVVRRSNPETVALFQRLCGNCHSEDGRGNGARAQMPRIPDFSNRSWSERHSDPQLAVSIREGKGAEMPSFRERLSDRQVSDLVMFLRAFAPGQIRQAQSIHGDFERRIQELKSEMNELRRRYDELSPRRAPLPPASASQRRRPRRPDRTSGQATRSSITGSV
jgi:mono/diheme cytochrome c family protein